MAEGSDHRLEMAMGRMLQIGVTVAALVVLLGGILYLKQFGGAQPDYRPFQGAPAGLVSVHGILSGLMHLDTQSVIGFGILLLIATPICRVIFGVVGFALLRDRFYAGVSAVVLGILLFSFFLRH
ncbi:MAG: DUF1634 domain-containing protein [Terracidiphilus sp.]|jgi:uncharacterized membrane protein